MKKKREFLIIGIIILLLIVILVVMKLANNRNIKDISIEEIIKSNKTEIVYVENSDKKKCEKCKEIKKYLDKNNIKYVLYDVNKHKKPEYEKMLQSLSINSSDFNYPAIIYIKDGSLYSDIININNTKVIDTFLKDNYILDK